MVLLLLSSRVLIVIVIRSWSSTWWIILRTRILGILRSGVLSIMRSDILRMLRLGVLRTWRLQRILRAWITQRGTPLGILRARIALRRRPLWVLWLRIFLWVLRTRILLRDRISWVLRAGMCQVLRTGISLRVLITGGIFWVLMINWILVINFYIWGFSGLLFGFIRFGRFREFYSRFCSTSCSWGIILIFIIIICKGTERIPGEYDVRIEICM